MSRKNKRIYPKREKAKRKQTRRSDLEQMIMDGCEIYRKEKTAFIDKVPEPAHIVKYIGNRKYIVRYGNEANNLFTGITSSGRMVAFCYAQSDNDRFGSACIREKIIKRLSDWQANGADCFVIISTPHKEYYRIPLRVWMSAKTTYKGAGIPKQNFIYYRLIKGISKELLFLSKSIE